MPLDQLVALNWGKIQASGAKDALFAKKPSAFRSEGMQTVIPGFQWGAFNPGNSVPMNWL